MIGKFRKKLFLFGHLKKEGFYCFCFAFISAYNNIWKKYILNVYIRIIKDLKQIMLNHWLVFFFKFPITSLM